MASSSSLAESFVLVPGEEPVQYSLPRPSFSPPTPVIDRVELPRASTQTFNGSLKVHGRHFVDEYGRVCQLRGVNLSGSCKTPVNDDHQTFPANAEDVTFVGRPFPLEEAHEHFSRLKQWGMTFIRFLVTWEAVEHAGPGIYDTDYLEYLHDLLSLLPSYGLRAFVALHQDVWSRYSGGSGAPHWTLTAVGFDLYTLDASGAAWTLGVRRGGYNEVERGVWPCGYQKLAASTMATCFWGGDIFARKLKIKDASGEEVGVQTFLQDAFLDMYGVLARKVGHLEGVIGFEMMNEPHQGYIGLPNLHSFDYNTELHLADVPSAFQSFLLGSGHPTSVAFWTRSWPVPTRHTSNKVINEAGLRAWRSDGPTGGECIWANEGVWAWDREKEEGVVLRESYFVNDPMSGRKLDWYVDFYYPFLKRWAERVRKEAGSEKIIFAEAIPNEFCPESWTPERRPENFVFAPHWYDLHALFGKAFGNWTVNLQGIARGMFVLKCFYWGQKEARENYTLQIRNIVDNGYRSLGETPVLIGECGIPMDMNKGAAFKTGDWTWQMRMMDALLCALERSLVGFTLWNYNSDNDDIHGDSWNGENFSWVGKTHREGRILPAIVRPYPAKTAGIPLRFEYEMTTGNFEFEWANPDTDADSNIDTTEIDGGGIRPRSVDNPPLNGHPPLTSHESEIFIPALLADGRRIVVDGLDSSAGDDYTYDSTRHTLFVRVADVRTAGKKHSVKVSFDPPVKMPRIVLNTIWTDFGLMLGAFPALVLAILVYWVAR